MDMKTFISYLSGILTVFAYGKYITGKLQNKYTKNMYE